MLDNMLHFILNIKVLFAQLEEKKKKKQVAIQITFFRTPRLAECLKMITKYRV